MNKYNEYVKQVLQAMQDYCREYEDCKGCKFYINDRCILAGIPDEWCIDEIGKENYWNKWNKLYSWLLDTRYAIAPERREGIKEYYIKLAKYELIGEILEYMNELDEEEHDET